MFWYKTRLSHERILTNLETVLAGHGYTTSQLHPCLMCGVSRSPDGIIEVVTPEGETLLLGTVMGSVNEVSLHFSDLAVMSFWRNHFSRCKNRKVGIFLVTNKKISDSMVSLMKELNLGFINIESTGENNIRDSLSRAGVLPS